MPEVNPGSEEHFRSAYRRDYRFVLAYAMRRTAARSDAEDVAAETFVVAWRRVAQLPVDPAEQRMWLYGIARNVLANHRRGAVRTMRLERRAQSLLGARAASPTDDAIDEASDVALALDVLHSLRDGDRELLTLALWEELTNPQIAMVTGTSAQNVSVRLHRAKQRFRAAFARQLQEPSSTRLGLRGAVRRSQEQEPTR